MSCVFVRIHPQTPPCLHPHSIVCVRVWIFILVGCGLTLFSFQDPTWILLKGVCWGRRCAYDWVETWQMSWCALWPTVFTLGAFSVSHHFSYFFSEKYRPSATRPHVSSHQFIQSALPVHLFFKNYYIGDCRCDWHVGHFSWSRKQFNYVFWFIWTRIWDVKLVCVIAILT